jgi:tetratricopeptide (TPR) repeat protein
MSEQQRPIWATRIEHERESRKWGKWEITQPEPSKIKSLARQISRWETGRPRPREWATAYATVFGTTVDELFGSSTTESGAFFTHDVEDDVRRRALLGMLATAVAAAPLGRDSERLRANLHEAVTGGANEWDADTWQRVADDYAHEVGRVPTSFLLPELLTDVAELNLLVTRATAPVRSRLIHSVAQLAVLTAIAFTILGDHRASRRWWRTAARAADEGAIPAFSSFVRGRQAVFALYDDRRSGLQALPLADEAIALGGGLPCAGVASGFAAKAQAYAQAGRHDEAAEALEDLKRLFDKLPDAVRTARTSQWGWPEQRLHHVASHVHTHAGDLARAEEAQDKALALYPASGYQGRTQIELHRAGCLLAAGDVDEGARRTVRILQGLPADLRSDGLLRRTAVISLGLAPDEAVTRPSLREAYELLALTSGDA